MLSIIYAGCKVWISAVFFFNPWTPTFGLHIILWTFTNKRNYKAKKHLNSIHFNILYFTQEQNIRLSDIFLS